MQQARDGKPKGALQGPEAPCIPLPPRCRILVPDAVRVRRPAGLLPRGDGDAALARRPLRRVLYPRVRPVGNDADGHGTLPLPAALRQRLAHPVRDPDGRVCVRLNDRWVGGMALPESFYGRTRVPLHLASACSAPPQSPSSTSTRAMPLARRLRLLTRPIRSTTASVRAGGRTSPVCPVYIYSRRFRPLPLTSGLVDFGILQRRRRLSRDSLLLFCQPAVAVLRWPVDRSHARLDRGLPVRHDHHPPGRARIRHFAAHHVHSQRQHGAGATISGF